MFWVIPASAEVIVSCGFEPAGDTWLLTTQAGGLYNTDPGVNDTPAGQRILSGSQSWLVNGTTSILTFAEVLLSGWTGVVVKCHVSSTAISGGSGNAPFDRVDAKVATTTYANQIAPVFGNTTDATLTGSGSGATWGYDSGKMLQVAVANGKRSLALQIYATNDDPTKCWNFDDMIVEGVRTTSSDVWWDGDKTGAVGGGSGTWDNLAANTSWASQSDGSSHAGWASARGDNAIFSQSGGTVTIAAGTTVPARSLTFQSDGYTILPGSTLVASRIALTNGGSGGPGANTIEVTQAGHTATILAPIAANPGVGLTKTGDGTLVLGGVNSYTGPTAIMAGVVSVSETFNLGADGAKVLFDGGTLRLTSPVNLYATHPCTFLSSGAIDTQSNNCDALTTGWSGAGSLTKIGAGTLSLDGDGSGFLGAVTVQQGTLKLATSQTLAGCSQIDVGVGATLDVSAVAGGYGVGNAGKQVLKGNGTIVGNLQIAAAGIHDVGNSPSVQRLDGNYSMNGALEIEISGVQPGVGVAGYDQVWITGDTSHNVLLDGELDLMWSGTAWSSAADRLWILRNDTDGTLVGTFRGYADGAVVGSYDGRSWQIFYGVDLDAATGRIVAGNDVLLASVPEPGSLGLVVVAGLLTIAASSWRRRFQA
jgi:autotransporter-associated beta strand protein